MELSDGRSHWDEHQGVNCAQLLPKSVFSALTLVTYYWPWSEYLHNGNWQTTN